MTLQLKHILEAALLAYHEPLTSQQLAELFPEAERPAVHEIAAALAELQTDYAERGIELKHVASGYRFQARAESATWIKNLWAERAPKYTRAFLETLALIAYRQPITRAEIEAVRGVAVNPNVIKTLLERNWIKVVGHRDVPGRPELLGTTKEFLDYFNIKSLSELPSLQEIQDLEATGSELEVQLQLLDAAEDDKSPRKSPLPPFAKGGDPFTKGGDVRADEDQFADDAEVGRFTEDSAEESEVGRFTEDSAIAESSKPTLEEKQDVL